MIWRSTSHIIVLSWTGGADRLSPTPIRKTIMTVSMYKISVPIFVQFLTALSAVLDKAAAHAEAHHIDPQVLVNMRLYPDMYTLARQVQQATSHAARVCAALAGVPVPDLSNTETTFREFKQRISKVIALLNSIKPEQIDGTDDKVVKVGEREMPGQPMLLTRSLPQFYFHCTTAYDILRHAGVPLGKSDFMGKPVGS
jgi:hypothetical protein